MRYNEAVQKTVRRILFIFFVCVFIGSSFFLIIQTQGLVFDWENFQFLKTGGIYIRSFPSDAEILINGKSVKRSISFFNKGTLIKDLFPKTYEIVVKKNDRVLWQKKLLVEPGMVASANVVRLFEKKPEIKQLSPRIVEDFWITNAGIVEKSGGKLFLGDILLRGTDLLAAQKDYTSIITTDEKNNLFFIDLQNPNTTTNISEIFSSLGKSKKIFKTPPKITNVFLHPFSPNMLILHTPKAVFLLDTKKVFLEKLFDTPTLGIFSQSAHEVFITTEKTIFSYNLLLGKSTISEQPIPNPYTITTTKNGDNFFITDTEKNLFFFIRSLASSTLLTKNVTKIDLSPNEEKLLIAHTNGTFSIFYLEEDTGDVKIPQYALRLLPKKADEKEKKDIAWLSLFPGYFSYLNEQTLSILEADIRSPQNVYAFFPETKKADRTEKIYILSTDGSLFSPQFKF